MASSVTESEPLFLPEDADELYALLAEEDAACPSCGLPLDETTDPDHPWVYDVNVLTCIACETKHEQLESLKDDGGNLLVGKDGRMPPGTLISVAESTDRIDDAGG